MARKVLKVTPLAGPDLLSVWGLGFLTFGEESQYFVAIFSTLGNYMALYLSSKLREQLKATIFSHAYLSTQYNELHINE